MTTIPTSQVEPAGSGNALVETYSGSQPNNDSEAAASRRSTQMSDSPESRAAADAKLSKPFAMALAARSYHTSIAPPDLSVPADTTLGRWRTELDNAFNSREFLTWAKEQGLDTKSMKLDPLLGELTGIVKGKTKTFSLSDDSGWPDVSRVLLSIARVIAPRPGQAFSYPWPEGKVPLYVVGRFYGVPIDLSPAQAADHRKKLQKGEIPEFPPSGYGVQRSVAALEEQRKVLGDDANHHALLAALRSQANDAEGKIDLNTVMLPLDRRSSLFFTEQRREISVAKMLESRGYNVPANSQEAHYLARSLSFDLLPRVPGADAGGVRNIVKALGNTQLRKMKAEVNKWKAQTANEASNPQAGVGADSLLHRLIGSLAESTRKAIADNPALAWDQLIRSPEALKLGKALQSKLNTAESPTGVIEILNAALVQELDPGLGKSPYNLAGYNLYSKDNAGAPAAEIVKRFVAHLEAKVGVGAAPIAARLLLSAAAPEFLSKNIPPNLVYGSHTWTDFSIAVALVEQDAPGASANMTFSQVIEYAEAQLNVHEGEARVNIASVNPYIQWGLANGVIASTPNGEYKDEDLEHSLTVFKKQKKELEWARAELQKDPPSRKELALAEFKRVFPEIEDPTENTLRGVLDSRYIVSPFDVYMTDPFDPSVWGSRDEKKLPWDQMKSRFPQLIKDINKKFDDEFSQYKKNHKNAWAIQFKYQLSLLPPAERERIENSDVSFLEVSRPFLGTKLQFNEHGHSAHSWPVPRTPTAQELDALKGQHGLLMKVEGRDGKTDYYSYFPALGKMVKEKAVPAEQLNYDDSAYFGPGAKPRVWNTQNIYTQYGETNKKRDPVSLDGKAQGSYFSGRTGSLANVVGDFFTKNYDAFQAGAAGVTEIEKTRREIKEINEFLLSLIPFYDGIKDAINGNVAGAIFNIGFDILGFLLPGVGAANKALKGGKSIGTALARSFFAGVGASVGITDAINLPKNIKRGIRTVIKDGKKIYQHADEVLPRLRGNYKKYDVTKTYKDGDIVKGVGRVDTGGVAEPVVAIFHKGGWYAYSSITNTPFGPQLLQFGALSSMGQGQHEAGNGSETRLRLAGA